MEGSLRGLGGDPELRLIETFAGDAPEQRLARHLTRMARGAARLGWPFDAARARAALDGTRSRTLRVRLTLDRTGDLRVESSALPPRSSLWRVAVASERLESADPWLALKSTRRAPHERARAGRAPGIDEVLLLNERGEVCEGGISTLFFDRGDGLRTPPVSCGLLPGVLREELLSRGAREELLLASELASVRLWMGNSLRGLIPAELERAQPAR
ncbi:MAG: aminotransferase class IV [Sorangiineae bacterium]|nr:aminotransferase class IV [Polyangiaceae bacterium]MEB2325204.1 aminotransferase class IV [Sorangiineae bacterium]